MKINEEALQTALSRLRKLRLTSVGGRKEHPAETVLSVFKRGLGVMFEDEAIAYVLRFAIEYYHEAVEHSVQSDGASTCAHTWSSLTVDGLKCIECGHITPRR